MANRPNDMIFGVMLLIGYVALAIKLTDCLPIFNDQEMGQYSINHAIMKVEAKIDLALANLEFRFKKFIKVLTR